jgi:NADPH2 dehydrogenase
MVSSVCRSSPLALASDKLPALGMGMPDPIPTFTGLVTRIRDSHPDFTYIHVVESTDALLTGPKDPAERQSANFLRDIWGEKPHITNANYDRDTAIEVVEKEGGLVSLGRYFISNVGVSSHTPSKRALISTNWSVLAA